jgi:hypothetical protein
MAGLLPLVSVVTLTLHITYDPAKRLTTLPERSLDFDDAPIIFMGPHLQYEDLRKKYGEARLICYGYLLTRGVQGRPTKTCQSKTVDHATLTSCRH